MEDEVEGEDEQVESPNKARKEFSEEEFLRKWDEDNAKVEIPPEVVDDIDNDFDIIYDDT